MAEQEHLITQRNFISNDPETLGFDLSSGTRWIYPENFPRRDYQFSIVQTALYNNTLVCLPTGLGKTFIAAVVMYNFWRWYPRGKVVFLAPTKPLVAQQINACHEIMGIPSEETVELTGAINQNKRRQAWINKRVIFATPQTFQKDLQNDCAPCELIKCIVIDEAHKALGKHSYCEIIRMVNEKTKFFRVLALSATPGSKIDHVREVIQNLLISELELRDDTSPDITPYTNDRTIEKIMVPLGNDLNEYKARYVNIMDPHVRILARNHVMQGNAANISGGRIFMLMKQYESRPQKSANHGTIMKTLNILCTMYHAYELLVKNGLRAFYQFYSNHSDKYWINQELDLRLMLEDVKKYLGDFPNIHPLPDGTIPDTEIPENLVFGHGKFDKLQLLLVEHFKSFSAQNKSTRAIVFVEYRDIVNEVHVLLLQKRPLIRPQIFVGQAGLKQKQQLAALDDFRNNRVNVLISTSVGEEGLDVGEVDLIVCFDISSSTPTRLVQRMGRTGRKRNGRVVILLTEGKELQTLNQAMSKKDSLNNKVLQSSNICSSLYQSSPRMVPTDLNPECYSLFIKALPKTPKTKGSKTKTNKPPAEKKPRKNKKKDADPQADDYFYVAQPSTSKVVPTVPKSLGSNQASMMKFLTDNRQQKKSATTYNYDSDSGVLCEEFQVPVDKNNPYAVIKPLDVRLITSDKLADEFLILCAMKKSNRETYDSNVLNVDTTWIPKRQPVGDLLRDFVVPSFDFIDCIKNLTLCVSPSDDDEISCRSNDSMCDFLPSDQNDFTVDSTNNFNEYPTIISKYAVQDENFNSLHEEKDDEMDSNFTTTTKSKYEKEKETDMDSDFTGDFTAIENNCKKESAKISPSDFMDDFTFNSGDLEPVQFDIPKQDKIDNLTQNQIDEISFIYKKINATQVIVQTPFENLLDEYTESETSQTNSLDGDKIKGNNIFDDLLSEASSEEDLFNSSQDHNDTIIPNKTLVESPKLESRLSFKRSASHSPPSEKNTKRQKISENISSDDEFEIVPGTPPKPKNDNSILNLNETFKPAPDTTYPDSDVDIFEDLEFDTQCSFTTVKDQLHLKQEEIVENQELINKEKNVSKFDEKQKSDVNFVHKENNELLILEEKINENSRGNDTAMTSAHNEVSLKRENVILVNNEKSDYTSKDVQTDGRTADKVPKNILSPSKSLNEINISDIDCDEWDDLDFSSIIVEKTKIEQEKKSSFFESSCKQTFIKPRSEESSSSGWISTDKKKPLSLKNLKAKFIPLKKSSVSSKSDFKINEKFNSKNSPSTSKWYDDDDEFQIFRPSKPSRLSLLKLKNPKDSVPKDKEGFVVPQPKQLMTESKTNENKSPVLQKTFINKENKLPRWRNGSRHKDNSISPRFRKYHSENNLCTEETRKRKKPKARKRIVNDFIEDEAEVSSDCETSEGSSGDNEDLENFVSHTQDVIDEVDIQAHYLQTINTSPVRPGTFLFKKPRNQIPIHEIYSQPMSQANETYLNDSFCVDEEMQEGSYSDNISSDDILENMESRLENRRKKLSREKKSKFKNLLNKRKAKSKIIRRNSSSESNNDINSSSEDETEALRKQIMEESMMMKMQNH